MPVYSARVSGIQQYLMRPCFGNMSEGGSSQKYVDGFLPLDLFSHPQGEIFPLKILFELNSNPRLRLHMRANYRPAKTHDLTARIPNDNEHCDIHLFPAPCIF